MTRLTSGLPLWAAGLVLGYCAVIAFIDWTVRVEEWLRR